MISRTDPMIPCLSVLGLELLCEPIIMILMITSL